MSNEEKRPTDAVANIVRDEVVMREERLEGMKKIRAEMRALEERMEQHLSPRMFKQWLAERSKPWAKVAAEIPFGKYKTPDVTLDDIREEFDRHLAGREKEKEEMLHKAASFIVNGRFRRPLLFVGPPGEGKSCFAKALASALGYPIKYINVPAINSPIAISGSERHYENSRIGEMLQTAIDEETLSIVFVFDEIDKAVNNKEGSVEATLLALFDPMWNGMFTDRSVCVPVDFSKCIFICTANDITSISEPLVDRMDVIRFDSYTTEQACTILENMTIPKTIKNSGVGGRIRFARGVAEEIVRYIGDGSMRDYEKMVEKLVDHAIYRLLTEDCRTCTVTVRDFDRVWPSEKSKAMGFGA